MSIVEHVEASMVVVPAGIELVRDFVDPQKWISSNYLMAMPGTHKAKVVRECQIELASFAMLSTPVTNELYCSVMGESASDAATSAPVVNISWIDSVIFCNRLSELAGFDPVYVIGDKPDDVDIRAGSRGFRLPTDAEWQFACRGMTTGYRYGDLDEIAWHEDNSDGELHEVAAKLPNQFGLFDMIGNVWEWCFDLYDTDRYGNYRVFRGGSYLSEARACGATSRRKSFPNFAAEDLGFRIVRSIEP